MKLEEIVAPYAKVRDLIGQGEIQQATELAAKLGSRASHLAEGLKTLQKQASYLSSAGEEVEEFKTAVAALAGKEGSLEKKAEGYWTMRRFYSTIETALRHGPLKTGPSSEPKSMIREKGYILMYGLAPILTTSDLLSVIPETISIAEAKEMEATIKMLGRTYISPGPEVHYVERESGGMGGCD